jgi:hypothetical protein
MQQLREKVLLTKYTENPLLNYFIIATMPLVTLKLGVEINQGNQTPAHSVSSAIISYYCCAWFLSTVSQDNGIIIEFLD